MFRLIVFALAGMVVPVAPAAAQNCAARSSFRIRRSAIGVTANLATNGTGVRFDGVYGRRNSWYGGASIGGKFFDDKQGTSLDVGGSLGRQFPLGKSPAEFCPYAF